MEIMSGDWQNHPLTLTLPEKSAEKLKKLWERFEIYRKNLQERKHDVLMKKTKQKRFPLSPHLVHFFMYLEWIWNSFNAIEKSDVTLWKDKSKYKVEYKQTEILMRAVVKSVIAIVENEWIRNEWVSTPYNVLVMQHTAIVYLIWHVLVGGGTIVHLSHSGLLLKFIYSKQLQRSQYKTFFSIRVFFHWTFTNHRTVG